MKSRKPEIKWGKADYPDYGIKFELIKTDTKEYIFIYHKKGKVRIRISWRELKEYFLLNLLKSFPYW